MLPVPYQPAIAISFRYRHDDCAGYPPVNVHCPASFGTGRARVLPVCRKAQTICGSAPAARMAAMSQLEDLPSAAGRASVAELPGPSSNFIPCSTLNLPFSVRRSGQAVASAAVPGSAAWAQEASMRASASGGICLGKCMVYPFGGQRGGSVVAECGFVGKTLMAVFQPFIHCNRPAQPCHRLYSPSSMSEGCSAGRIPKGQWYRRSPVRMGRSLILAMRKHIRPCGSNSQFSLP